MFHVILCVSTKKDGTTVKANPNDEITIKIIFMLHPKTL